MTRIQTARQELSALIDPAAPARLNDPAQTRAALARIADALAACESLIEREERDTTRQKTRIAALAQELAAIIAPPAEPSPAQPAAAPVIEPAPPPPAAPARPGGRLNLAEDIWLLSRSVASPTCEVFTFEVSDAAGTRQPVRIETHRIGDKTQLKTRSPLIRKDRAWVSGKDSFGPFHLCHHDRIDFIQDRKIRTIASYALK